MPNTQATTESGPGARIARSIRDRSQGRPALIPFITAGFPTQDAFRPLLLSLAPHAAVIEVGVPFTDPMADGVTLQRTSRVALENGVTLAWILDELRELRATMPEFKTPVVLMGYLNPFIAFGIAQLAETGARKCNPEASPAFDALIIPDLPLEESADIRAALHSRSIGLVQLVSPVTPPERAARIAAASDGFVYAVTTTGVTGASKPVADITAYLDALRSHSPVPVCAGFGIRTRDHVEALAAHADGIIIGSALMQEVEAGRDPAALLRSLAD